MKQRLITAAFGMLLLIAVLFFYNTIVLNVTIALIALMAVYEVLISTRYVGSRFLFALCAVFAVTVPFFHIGSFRFTATVLCYLFVLILFLYLFAHHKTVHLEKIGTVFLLTLLMSFSFSCIVLIRDRCAQDIAVNKGLFYIILVFIGAWITDAGGYFVGRFFGKRKLAPEISPKKTVEGAVGGFVCTIVFFLLAGVVYSAYGNLIRIPIKVNFGALLLYAVLCAAVAILGDLSASIIKRECHIKDFGNIIPGHGGVLDRFDSILYVAPLIFILMQIWPIV